MKKSLITPTFLKQKAKQLKKEKSINLHQALEEIAIQHGFSNYRHFLNEWEAANQPKSKTEIESLLRKLSSEEDIAKKLELAIPFVQRNVMSFPEMFEVFDQFRSSPEAVQTICENTFFLDHVANTMMLQYFQVSKEDVQVLPLKEHFVAMNVVVEDLECELITERLNVKGMYTIEFEFEYWSELEEDMKQMPHFNRPPMFGQFEMTIDRNKQVTIANPTIGEIGEDGLSMGRFKLGIPEHRRKESAD